MDWVDKKISNVGYWHNIEKPLVYQKRFIKQILDIGDPLPRIADEVADEFQYDINIALSNALFNHYGLYVRPAKYDHGFGLFSARYFAAGEEILQYIGVAEPADEVALLPDSYNKCVDSGDYSTAINGSRTWFILPNIAGFANHDAIVTNCMLKQNSMGGVSVFATKEIRGSNHGMTELFLDYGDRYWDILQ